MFRRTGHTTRLFDTFETGGLRVRIPNSGGGCEAVVLNTAGGLAGGDEAHLTFVADSKSNVRITTQSAEKIYRTDDKPAVVATKLLVGDGARAAWIPQETILFDGSGLKRSLEIDVAKDASVIAGEMTVFGRVARGEQLGACSFRDRWRIRREGSLIFADDVCLEGGVSEIMRHPALGDGANAVAMLVYVSSRAAGRVEALRTVIRNLRVDGGVSAWNGILVVRLAGKDPYDVREAMAQVLQRLQRSALPRVWSI